MQDNLHIEELLINLKYKTVLSVDDIVDFYREYNPNTPISTIRWRIHSLVDRGVLHSVGRGLYMFGAKKGFVPEIYRKTEAIAGIMRKRLPFAEYCQWDYAVHNAFSMHLSSFQIYFVDVEREATEAAYYEIKERYPKTIMQRHLAEDLPSYDGFVVVRNMVSSAPIVCNGDFRMASLEKILVDFTLDRVFTFPDSELYTMYGNAFEAYSINRTRMLRYAERRGRRNVVEHIINETER